MSITTKKAVVDFKLAIYIGTHAEHIQSGESAELVSKSTVVAWTTV